MNKEAFIKLTIPEKMELLWAEGEFISEKSYYDNNISLFLMSTFLVEVFFNQACNEIVSVEIQENHQILFEYVKDIELAGLFK